MDKTARKKMIIAMEYIARTMNNDDYFETWLSLGVPDGMLDKSLNIEQIDDDDIMLWDNNFSELMDAFLVCMKNSYKDGGLLCDGVLTSKG